MGGFMQVLNIFFTKHLTFELTAKSLKVMFKSSLTSSEDSLLKQPLMRLVSAYQPELPIRHRDITPTVKFILRKELI